MTEPESDLPSLLTITLHREKESRIIWAKIDKGVNMNS